MVFNLKCEQKQVHDAGHMVPMDQPRVAMEMLKRFFQDKLPQGPSSATKLAAQM